MRWVTTEYQVCTYATAAMQQNPEGKPTQHERLLIQSPAHLQQCTAGGRRAETRFSVVQGLPPYRTRMVSAACASASIGRVIQFSSYYVCRFYTCLLKHPEVKKGIWMPSIGQGRVRPATQNRSRMNE
jgi:hypothetical protein